MNKKIYDHPVYWLVPDDGALFKCDVCGERKSHKDMLLFQTPNGNRGMCCKLCIDDDWLASAENLGVIEY